MHFKFFQKLFNPKKPHSDFSRAFENHFGFRPHQEIYYQIAFTHRSDAYSEPHPLAGPHNERLEFLGDSVINTIVSDYLFQQIPEADEGHLTQMRSILVKRDNLNEWAKIFEIPAFLKHDKGLTQNRQFKETVYGNAFEAFIGAIYLDRGFLFTYNFLKNQLLSEEVNLQQLKSENNNFKSRLIEWSQKNNVQINFEITSKENAEKNSTFKAKVYIEGQLSGEGEAKRKKDAEQMASKNALACLGLIEPRSNQ